MLSNTELFFMKKILEIYRVQVYDYSCDEHRIENTEENREMLKKVYLFLGENPEEIEFLVKPDEDKELLWFEAGYIDYLVDRIEKEINERN